jgi:hypothetical protein
VVEALQLAVGYGTRRGTRFARVHGAILLGPPQLNCYPFRPHAHSIRIQKAGVIPCASLSAACHAQGGDWISGLQEWAQTMDSRKNVCLIERAACFQTREWRNRGVRARRCLQPDCRRHATGAGTRANLGTRRLAEQCPSHLRANDRVDHSCSPRAGGARPAVNQVEGSRLEWNQRREKAAGRCLNVLARFTTAEEVRRPNAEQPAPGHYSLIVICRPCKRDRMLSPSPLPPSMRIPLALCLTRFVGSSCVACRDAD